MQEVYQQALNSYPYGIMYDIQPYVLRARAVVFTDRVIRGLQRNEIISTVSSWLVCLNARESTFDYNVETPIRLKA